MECDFGYVGSDSTEGRMCVPWKAPAAAESCGDDGQDACTGVLPSSCLPCLI